MREVKFDASHCKDLHTAIADAQLIADDKQADLVTFVYDDVSIYVTSSSSVQDIAALHCERKANRYLHKENLRLHRLCDKPPPTSDFDRQCELAALEAEVHGMDAHNAHQTAIGESSMYEQGAYERIADQIRELKEG